jgi:hypothetical protein
MLATLSNASTASEVFGLPDDPRAAYHLAMQGWIADYADPFNFINLLFAAGSELRSPAVSLGPVFETRMAAAARLTGMRRLDAYAPD